MAIALLTTRVKQPNMEYYKMLVRCVRYVRSKTNTPLMLEVSKTSVTRWSINSAYWVHPDTKSHSVEMVSLGKIAT